MANLVKDIEKILSSIKPETLAWILCAIVLIGFISGIIVGLSSIN